MNEQSNYPVNTYSIQNKYQSLWKAFTFNLNTLWWKVSHIFTSQIQSPTGYTSFKKSKSGVLLSQSETKPDFMSDYVSFNKELKVNTDEPFLAKSYNSIMSFLTEQATKHGLIPHNKNQTSNKNAANQKSDSVNQYRNFGIRKATIPSDNRVLPPSSKRPTCR